MWTHNLKHNSPKRNFHRYYLKHNSLKRNFHRYYRYYSR